MPNTNTQPIIITSDDFKNNKNEQIYKGKFSIDLSPNFDYLNEYLSKLGCTHCVIEPEYISMSYWYDYASYYANQTSTPSKFTKRVHFFNGDKIADKESVFLNFGAFHEYLMGLDTNEINAYLGYAVIKDLPDPRSAIGVMLLATYPQSDRPTDNTLRYYLCTKQYEVNLFGKKLFIDSLVTQSQTSVSACASTALFSAIHLLSHTYITPKLFPAQITKLAYRKYPNQQRAFPNREGLDVNQVVGVLRELRLAHEIVSFNNSISSLSAVFGVTTKDYFKGLLYAYNECSIPVLVMIERFDQAPQAIEQKGDLHLVLSAGYRIDYGSINRDKNRIKLFSDRIEKHFIMDDNRGAFTAVVPSSKVNWDLETQKKTTKNDTEIVFYDKLYSVIIPLERSVSVDYKTILAYTEIFNSFNLEGNETKMEWQIKLQLSNSYKEDLMAETNRMSTKRRTEVLVSNLPKYIWHVRLCKDTINTGGITGTQSETFVEFVYDATVAPESSEFCRFVNFNAPDNASINLIINRIDKGVKSITEDTKPQSTDKQIIVQNCCSILERERENLIVAFTS